MNDIRQKTNTSNGGTPDGTESHHGNTISYEIFNLTSGSERVVKLGYCCEPCGIGLPIYIL